jgi:tetratricopeptide (TPR) repeat protein
MSLSAGTKLGPYEIVAPLGAGGMGEVYRAHDSKLDRDVALKVLPEALANDPKSLSRFEAEAKAVAALSHPSILAIHDFGRIGEVSFAVMELLEGKTLRETVSRGPLPLRKALDVAVQVAEGLAAAHARGIVHRDVKPENIFLTGDGHAKILDFGLAHRSVTLRGGGDTESPTMEKLTDPGHVLGTVAYMSPEQARGENVDYRSDQFSFGVVLYEMLAGERPFKGASAAETLAAIIRDEPVALERKAPGAPVPVQMLVERCLAKDPRERYESTRDLARDLAAWRTHSSGAAAVSTGGAGPKPAALQTHRALIGIAGAALLVAALVGGGLWLRSQGARPAAGGTPSVLALPCRVYGAPEAEYLTDAVPGVVSTLLAGVAGLDTKVPPSSFEVEKLKGDLSKIAEAYRVENLLLTTLTAQGNQFVLSVQLVEAGTRKVRWGKQYEGALRDFNELARQAANGVRQALSPAAAPVPTAAASSEVELAFQEGKHFRNRFYARHKTADFDLALRSFTRAFELDRSSARAPAEIARLDFFRFVISTEVKWLRESETWARKALDLDPESGVAWAARTWVLNYVGEDSDLEKAIEYGLKAIRYAPWDAWAFNSIAPTVSNPGSELLALAALRRARDVDPLDFPTAWAMGNRLLRLSRAQEALETIDQGLRLEPGWQVGHVIRGWALLKLGRLGEATDALQRGEPPPTDVASFEDWRFVRLALALAENDAATVKTLEAPLFDLVSGKRSGFCVKCKVNFAAYMVAPGLARAGRKDDALRILLRSIEVGIPPSYDFLLLEPDFQGLRSDPRFAKVLDEARHGASRMARCLEGVRARGELPPYLEEPLDVFLKQLKEKPPGS